MIKHQQPVDETECNDREGLLEQPNFMVCLRTNGNKFMKHYRDTNKLQNKKQSTNEDNFVIKFDRIVFQRKLYFRYLCTKMNIC